MGQYFIVCNLTKRECIHPHKLGVGLKAWEQMGSYGGTTAALFALLVKSSGSGGGDLQGDPMIGRWAGDRIVVIGDYAEPQDLPARYHAERLFEWASDQTHGWIDISESILPVLLRELDGEVVSDDGWKNIAYNGEILKALKPDLVVHLHESKEV